MRVYRPDKIRKRDTEAPRDNEITIIWRFCDIQHLAFDEKRGALTSTGDLLKGPLMNYRANPARDKKRINIVASKQLEN